MEQIKTFYSRILEFFNAGSILIQIECANTVRMIVNGGVDHSVLKVDVVPWVSRDGMSVQITDTDYIQSLLRAAGGLSLLVSNFCGAVRRLEAAQSKYGNTVSPARTHAQEDEAEGSHPASPTSRPDRDIDSDSDDGEVPGAVSNENDGEEMANALKKDMYDCRKLTEGMLYVCLDLSEHAVNASCMCSEGISDAAIMLIDVTDSPRDIWTSKCVELLWNCLEEYFNGKEDRGVNGEDTHNFISPEELTRHDTAVVTFELALGVLRNLFLSLLFDGYRNADKELRNETIIVLSLIAKDERSIPYFVKSGMLTDLVTYSCAAEVGSNGWFYASNPMAKLRNFASVFDVDLQLKRELWLLVSDLIKSDDPAVLLCVASSPFLRVLCKYLEYDTTAFGTETNPKSGDVEFEHEEIDSPQSLAAHSFPLNAPSVSTTSLPVAEESVNIVAPAADIDLSSTFPKTEPLPPDIEVKCETSRDDYSNNFLSTIPVALMCELQVLASVVLSDCCHRMMAEFLRIGGPAFALSAVDRNMSSTSPEHKTFVNGCLLLLNKTVTFSKVGKKTLEDLCAIQYLLRLFETSTEDNTKTQVLRLISLMALGSTAAQNHLCDFGGVPTLVRALAKYPLANQPLVGQTCGVSVPNLLKSQSPPDASTEEVSMLMVSLLDAVWLSIVGNSRNEGIFAECEGIDALLETLECSPFLLRGMTLRVFSDLLMNRRLLAFVESWRSSRTMRSVHQILAHAWMDEEIRLGVSRDSGVLCNMWNPLNSHEWPVDPRLQEPVGNSNAPPGQVGAAGSFVGSVNTDCTSSVWFHGGTSTIDGGDGGFGDNESPTAKSSIVEKLTQAVTMNRKDTAGSYVALGVRLEASSKDMRGVLANLLSALGLLDGDIIDNSGAATEVRPSSGHFVHGDEGSVSSSTVGEGLNAGVLSPTDKQVLCVAKRYDTLREGEWWKCVFEDLHRTGVNPIEEDIRKIELKLDAAFEAAQASQFEQMELNSIDKRNKVKSEGAFMGQIIRQKNQQIKSEWLKRNAHKEKTGRKQIGSA